MRPPAIDDVLPDYYAELGVAPTASAEDIESSYTSFAHAFRIEINNSTGALLRMASIDRAYRVLGDRRKRSAYDLLRRAQFGSFILLLVRPRAHPRGRVFLFLLAVLAALLVVSLVSFRWEIVMYVLGLGSVVIALSRALLEWIVPTPGPTRPHAVDDGA